MKAHLVCLGIFSSNLVHIWVQMHEIFQLIVTLLGYQSSNLCMNQALLLASAVVLGSNNLTKDVGGGIGTRGRSLPGYGCGRASPLRLLGSQLPCFGS